MQGPPCDEPGFQSLPMFGGEINELAQATTPQRLVMVNSQIREGITVGGMAATQEGPSLMQPTVTQAQFMTNYATRFGALGAQLSSQGMLTLGIEGCSPHPNLSLNSTVGLVPQGLAMGEAKAMLMTGVGMVTAQANLFGQMSAELLTGLQPSPTSQLMLGAHAWGQPGLLGGLRAAAELQSMVLDEREQITASSALTLEITSPRVGPTGAAADATPSSWSVSAFHRTSPTHSVAANYTQPKGGDAFMWLGGTRQLNDSTRLRGKWSTRNLLSLALEVSGDRSAVTIQTETSTAGPLAPKFGATLTLSP